MTHEKLKDTFTDGQKIYIREIEAEIKGKNKTKNWYRILVEIWEWNCEENILFIYLFIIYLFIEGEISISFLIKTIYLVLFE